MVAMPLASPMPGSSRTTDELDSLLRLARRLYAQCRDANESYKDVGREVHNVHRLLRHLKHEQGHADDEQANRDVEVTPLLQECRSTLDALDGLIKNYYARDKSTTEGLRLRNGDQDQLRSLRVKLIKHKMALTALLDSLESDREGNGDGNQRDPVLEDLYDRIDKIGSRLGQKAGSTMTLEDDEEDVWRQFQRELDSEGVPDYVFSKYKTRLRSYVRKLDKSGVLSENPAKTNRQPTLSVNTSRWLDDISHPSPTQYRNYADSPGTDLTISTKNLSLDTREEDMKYQQSMKDQRPRPHNLTDSPRDRHHGGGASLALVRVPEPEIISTALILASDAKEMQHPQMAGRMRRLSDLSDRTTPRSPIVGSPASPRASFSDHNHLRSGPGHGTLLQPGGGGSDAASLYGASPRSSAGTVPNYGASPRTSNTFYSYSSSPATSTANPRDSGVHLNGNLDPKTKISSLAPDPDGRPIPADAKWTRVKRSLISPQVLDEERLRYEARPEFVAILGVIPRAKLQELAERTQIIRERRRRDRDRDKDRAPPRPGSRSGETPVSANLPRIQKGFGGGVNVPAAVAGAAAGVAAAAAAKKEAPREPPRETSKNVPPPQPHAKKNVRFDDDELKSSGSDTDSSTDYTTESDTESSLDRRNRRRRGSDSRGGRSAPSGKDRDRDRPRDDRRQGYPVHIGPDAGAGHGRAEPLNIYSSSPSAGRSYGRDHDRDRERDRHKEKERDQYLSPTNPRGSHHHSSRYHDDSYSRRGTHHDDRRCSPDGRDRDRGHDRDRHRDSEYDRSRENSRDRRDDRSDEGKEGRGGHRKWGKRVKAGGLGAAAGTFLSVLTDAAVDVMTL